MSFLDGERIVEEYLAEVLHPDTQVEEASVSLTAASVARPTSRGELDFGGSEFQLGDREEVAPVTRELDDDYGWWSLEAGHYLLELNETIQLEDDERALLQPHDHLLWNGVSHPTLMLSADETNMRLTLPLTVPDPGVEIKENARVSSVRVYSERSSDPA